MIFIKLINRLQEYFYDLEEEREDRRLEKWLKIKAKWLKWDYNNLHIRGYDAIYYIRPLDPVEWRN